MTEIDQIEAAAREFSTSGEPREVRAEKFIRSLAEIPDDDAARLRALEHQARNSSQWRDAVYRIENGLTEPL